MIRFRSSLPALLLSTTVLAGGPSALPEAADTTAATPSADDLHAALFVDDLYPSATACRTCHPRHYEEWSVSQHAYAQVSPVFNAMQAKVNELTNGSTGDFCIRCHTPVGMALGEPVFTAAENRHPTSLEGVTCVSCHRINEAHGKFSARTPLVTGSLHDTVYGPTGGDEVARVIDSGDFKVTTAPGQGPGRPIHQMAERFFQLTEPSFCGRCHDVTQADGFRLEEAFSEYKTSHAAASGLACQDCHMGKVPGDPTAGYDYGPAAVVGGVPTRDRKLTNHMIVGPDHTVIHPGIFPHSPAAKSLASMKDWVLFDWEAGWGTDDFEDTIENDDAFPPAWRSVDDRYDAREILDDHLALLQKADDTRVELLKTGYVLGDVRMKKQGRKGLRFDVDVVNGIDSHNVPTGFTAERIVFLRIELRDAAGELVFTSGDLDANGDLRDLHSRLVHAGEVPRDKQLFSLQSKFLTRNLRGGEREQVLAVNHSIDALPFLRPETVPTTLTGRPRGARLHKKGIEPGGKRTASYRVDRKALAGPGPHQLQVQLIAGMVPVNLIHAIQSVGFDFDLSAAEIAERVVEGHRVLHERTLEIDLDGDHQAWGG
ncbi:MAG: multiheme c-type cytochrome [Acidobacteriota bacterium]